jgi:hypothetical protein
VASSYLKQTLTKDPYFLYSASNLGSLLALLGYPFLLETNFTLRQQNQFWFIGFSCFAVLIIACSFFSYKFHKI